MNLIVSTVLLLVQMSEFVTSTHYCRNYTYIPGEYNVLGGGSCCNLLIQYKLAASVHFTRTPGIMHMINNYLHCVHVCSAPEELWRQANCLQ